MFYFAGFKGHYSLFAASGTFLVALEDWLRGYDRNRGNSGVADLLHKRSFSQGVVLIASLFKRLHLMSPGELAILHK